MSAVLWLLLNVISGIAVRNLLAESPTVAEWPVALATLSFLFAYVLLSVVRSPRGTTEKKIRLNDTLLLGLVFCVQGSVWTFCAAGAGRSLSAALHPDDTVGPHVDSTLGLSRLADVVPGPRRRLSDVAVVNVVAGASSQSQKFKGQAMIPAEPDNGVLSGSAGIIGSDGSGELTAPTLDHTPTQMHLVLFEMLLFPAVMGLQTLFDESAEKDGDHVEGVLAKSAFF